jgi:hypothetical protein
MSKDIPRRDALRRLAVLSLSTFAPMSLLACSKRASCLDVSGLSTDEVNQRNNVAAYTEQATDPAKPCASCAQFVPTAPDKCGSCKIVKGPINPQGGCKLWVAKPS